MSESKKVKKVRLDLLLVERRLVASRTLAQRLIMAGKVIVDGQVIDKVGIKVRNDCELELKEIPKYVSRAGYKLETALDEVGLNVSGLVCLDVGSSTGGFTDCLLQRGARKVFAVDVGKGLLDWKLRNDERVVLLEGINFRYFDEKLLDENVDLVVVDVSFISILKLMNSFKKVIATRMNPGGKMVALIKPQFEAGKEIADRYRGVIPSELAFDIAMEVREKLIKELYEVASEDFEATPLIPSKVKGDKGNQEFLVVFYNLK